MYKINSLFNEKLFIHFYKTSQNDKKQGAALCLPPAFYLLHNTLHFRIRMNSVD